MSANKRRNPNTFPLASVIMSIVVAVFAGAGGLCYVFFKNQLHTTGTRIKNLERELTDLRNRNEVARAHIAQLSSTRALQERFDHGFIKLSKITDDRIVSVRAQNGPKEANELRAVSNPGGRK